MKKKIIAITAICAAITMSVGLAACDTTPKDEGTYYTVTYMDGTTVLKTEKVKEGEVAPAYTPTKEGGYQFVDWFATPSKNHRYDTTAAITEDVTVYAGFTLYSDDTRDFYIIGAGTSTILIDGWGNINDAHKFTKTDGKNEYKITLDLLEGDQFVIVAGVEYESKRGAGYLVTSALADGTEVFGGAGSVYDDSSKGKNIEVKYSGNYTLTLNTYPADDYYNTAGEGYTEARKEIYRMGTYDTISWVRNGNPEVTTVSVTDYFIKGKNISKWGNYINDAHLMKRDGNNYSLSVYLEEGEEFMFASWNTVTGSGETTSALGSTYIKSNALDTASQTLLNGYSEAGGNMTAKASGVYTFNYNESTKVLAVTFEDKAEKQYDYYLDGKYGDQNWKAETLGEHKLTGTNGVYTITADLVAGDVIAVRSYEVGAELVAGYAGYVAVYGSKFATLGEAFKDNYNNIEVVTAGKYDFTFDNYSKILTITQHTESADTLDIYIKGANVNNWSHGWSADYLLKISSDETKYEYTLTVEADKTVKFGFEKHPKGETTGYGDYLGVAAMGTSGDANALFTPESGSDFTCSTAGMYKVVYDIETGKVDFFAAENLVTVYDIYLKGEQWGWGLKAENILEVNATDKNVYEITLALDANQGFMFQQCDVGSTTQIQWYNAKDHTTMGTSGDANNKVATSESNFKVTEAGTYKIVLNIETGIIDFYTVAE